MNLQTETPKTNSLTAWLFNPFMYIAGWTSLFFGWIAILAAGLIGSTGNVHFDGVLDVHITTKTSLWYFIAEGFIAWLSMTIVLLAAAFILKGTAFRIIDILGTQALARWPMIFSALAGLPPANHRVINELLKKLQDPDYSLVYSSTDFVIYSAATAVIISMSVWMIILMYRGYAVSCNLKGTKAIVSFIVCLIIAEFGLFIVNYLFLRRYNL